jgi:UDP-glucose 4-epimerase
MLAEAAQDDVVGRSFLVTGGAGFIGSHLVDRLIMDGASHVFVVDNFFLGSDANLAESVASGRVSVLRMDGQDFAGLNLVARDSLIDTIFNLAVVPLPTSLSFPKWVVDTNISLTTTACELVRQGAARQLLHCSSSEVYGSSRYVPMDESHPHDVLTPYAASKSGADKVVESYVRSFGIRATTVRPFNNFGPRQSAKHYAGVVPLVIDRVRRGQPIEVHGDGLQTRDFIFVRDTVGQIVRIAASEKCVGECLNIGSGIETSILDLINMILDVLGLDSYPIVHVDNRPGDVRRHLADVSKARRIVGFKPTPISRSSLSETVEWYLSGAACD